MTSPRARRFTLRKTYGWPSRCACSRNRFFTYRRCCGFLSPRSPRCLCPCRWSCRCVLWLAFFFRSIFFFRLFEKLFYFLYRFPNCFTFRCLMSLRCCSSEFFWQWSRKFSWTGSRSRVYFIICSEPHDSTITESIFLV